ncbi:MAG: hypothetical protein NTY77_17655 [Elusimicrobia bacterium]|nr:hypothetical protein [Elusimicrobiota bacterium]
MKRFFAVVCIMVAASPGAFGFVYSEHKAVGDKACRNFIQALVQDGVFPSTDAALSFFSENLGAQYDRESDTVYFTKLSNPPNLATCGVLNALSGDYEENLFTLNEGLSYRYSDTNAIIHLQNVAMADFKDSAAYSDIIKIKPKFPYMALINNGHFFDYGDSLEDQIRQFEKPDLELLKSPKNGPDVFRDLDSDNLLREYLTLHAFAIHLAQEAGKCAQSDKARSATDLSYAFMYNAFADHFLEDSFASGHMVVNRTIFGGIINNKALHDFYNRIGLDVMNLGGEIWKTYGDHMLFRGGKRWKSADTYDHLAWREMPEAAVKVTAAVTQSLLEVWRAYDRARQGDPDDILARVPDDEEKFQGFFIDNFAALSMMPVPFGSDLDDYKLDPAKLAELKKVNAPLSQRNFVRTRVANSVILNLGTYDMWGTPRDFYGLRLNMSSYNNYHDAPDKTGTVDQWVGYTGSVNLAAKYSEASVSQYKVGGTYNCDVWVSRKRYFGVYSYLETGLQSRSGQQHLLLSPAVGLQLGPLIGLDNYTLPRWLWVPLQLIVPLKFVFNPNYAVGAKPAYNFYGEIDLLF